MLVDGCEDCGRKGGYAIMGNEDSKLNQMKVIQICPANRKVFEFHIQSSSDPETAYEIKGSFVQGEISCSCPGFKFRQTCKHLQVEVEECGWNAMESAEPQTMDQRDSHVCPRCGGRTIDAGQGNF